MMMTLIKEVFDLLASKGVYRKVQHLFLDVLKDDYWGKLSSDYFGMNGKVLDQEMFSFSKIRFPSEGIPENKIG